MPNWKKVIVSGSSANLYELNVDSSITASIVSASQFTGSLFGTASWAVSSSCALFAITASYVETAQTASYVLQAISASYALISSNSVSSSYALTASYADNVPTTASYALQALSSSYASTASFAYGFPDQGYNYTQSPGSSTWNINHNLNTYTPLVDVYDSTYHQLIPASVTSIDANNTRITFSTAQAGFAIISKGSGLSSQSAISASFATSASYALTASYAANVPDTASYALQALSSSLAATASHADVFTIGGSQMMYSNTPSTSAGNNGIFATSTGSFAGAFYQYTLYSGSNARSENANAVWTSTTSSYTNYSTIDVGDTLGVVGSVVITGGQVQLNILTPTAGWTVRAVATFV